MRHEYGGLTSDSYTITASNPRRKGLPPLLDADGRLTRDGETVAVIMESLGYEVRVGVEE